MLTAQMLTTQMLTAQMLTVHPGGFPTWRTCALEQLSPSHSSSPEHISFQTDVSLSLSRPQIRSVTLTLTGAVDVHLRSSARSQTLKAGGSDSSCESAVKLSDRNGKMIGYRYDDTGECCCEWKDQERVMGCLHR